MTLFKIILENINRNHDEKVVELQRSQLSLRPVILFLWKYQANIEDVVELLYFSIKINLKKISNYTF